MNKTKRELLAELDAYRVRIARLEARETNAVLRPSAARDAIMQHVLSEQETFVVCLLDARQKVLHAMACAVGTASSVEVHPRDVFRAAIRYGAESLIMGHNHPSGDLSPSDSDHELTKRMCAAGRIIGVPIVDHIIVGPLGGYHSMAAAGQMPVP